MRKPTLLLQAILWVPSVAFSQVIVDDSWADGDRFMLQDPEPLDANWWSSSAEGANSVEVSLGMLGLVTGSSGRGLHATFTPQQLEIGDRLVATATFTTPATVGEEREGALKVGIMDFNSPGLADDLQSNSSSPQSLYFDLPGYMIDFDVNTFDPEVEATTENTSIWKHNLGNTTGRFLGTTSEWTFLSESSPEAGYSIVPETEYVVEVSLRRTGDDRMEINGALSQDGSLLSSHSAVDDEGIANNIGMLGFWVISRTFGSSSVAGNPNNGIDFTHVVVELEPAGSIDPVITNIDYDKGAGEVTIEWIAQVGVTYSVYASDDLLTFSEKVGEVTADEESMTFSESEVATARRFYHVVAELK